MSSSNRLPLDDPVAAAGRTGARSPSSAYRDRDKKGEDQALDHGHSSHARSHTGSHHKSRSRPTVLESALPYPTNSADLMLSPYGRTDYYPEPRGPADTSGDAPYHHSGYPPRDHVAAEYDSRHRYAADPQWPAAEYDDYYYDRYADRDHVNGRDHNPIGGGGGERVWGRDGRSSAAFDTSRSPTSFLPSQYVSRFSNFRSAERREFERRQLEEDLAYGYLPASSPRTPRPISLHPPPPSPSPPPPPPRPPFGTSSSYAASTPQWEYARPEDLPPRRDDNGGYEDAAGQYTYPPSSPSLGAMDKPPRSRDSGSYLADEPRIDDDHRVLPPSPKPPTARMSNLTLQLPSASTTHLAIGSAPGSPLLESYSGTYQTMSPMPSPSLLSVPSNALVPLPPASEALSPLASEDERGGEKKRARRARFHDPVDDAARLAHALKGEWRAPDTEPLIEILPGMTHEQIMELRSEYKRLVKTGPDRKGVNVAKHIRARMKDEDPNLMKACYATALGRWESEAYWANFWYQGHKTRHELLIESLMGRTNADIRAIKEAFRDRKYGSSLIRCMRTELREDKFKKAVLMVLDEQRMDETDDDGRPLPIDHHLIDEDVKELHDAIKRDRGGESTMIRIVIKRSDSHLREVQRVYSDVYGSNFAKDALKKSGNLVGELLVHILNGVINKPVRDAMLLHHALTASKQDELRREFLTSRLVRYHWDRHHIAGIRLAYRERYGRDLLDAVREGTSGEWGQFCEGLCIARTPDDVRQVERVSDIQ